MTVHHRAQAHAESSLDHVIPNESELTAGVLIEAGKSYGFFTDTTVCIGCKACEVACKEWNNLPADSVGLTGQSFDNTGTLSANSWRHVAFVEKSGAGGVREQAQTPFQSGWLMMSDVCKHCHNAPCMEACPTGSLFKTEFDTVVVQQDICNGCGYCVPACPFGVVALSPVDGKAHKCTLCYDRLKGGLEPACAKACPTDSIQFGELGDLQARAQQRVEVLHDRASRAPTFTERLARPAPPAISGISTPSSCLPIGPRSTISPPRRRARQPRETQPSRRARDHRRPGGARGDDLLERGLT